MGLAAIRVKQRFGFDPRNTAWSNDTNKFGYMMLEKYGWKPGMGLGNTPDKSSKTHIRVSIKDDNLGLGARSQTLRDKDDRDCTGLDDFQRLLGKLNGKEEIISRELDRRRADRIIDGKWGVHFIKGEVLSSTWDPSTMKLKDYSNKDENKKKKVTEKIEDERRKKHRLGKKEKKKEKKEKRRKQKMEKKEKKGPSRPELTRLSARSKYIRQKRAATMDPRALDEIFMVTQ